MKEGYYAKVFFVAFEELSWTTSLVGKPRRVVVEFIQQRFAKLFG